MKRITLFIFAGIGGLIYWLISWLRTKPSIDVFAGVFIVGCSSLLLLFFLNLKRLSQHYG